jgi:hypothetical protein
MSGQNPIIPSPTDAKGIDAVVYDLQTHLDFSLSWLTNGLGRAYRMAKVEVNKSTFYLPQIYLGTAKSTYFAGVPDNDKQGQNFIYVGDGVLTDPQNVGFYGYMEYPISIVFSANLKLIDATLLETEDFTEHLISDVRQALIRNLIGKSYRLRVDNIQREFDDVFSEFDIINNRGIDLLPLTHFRFNCTLLMKEVCNETTLNRCQAITQNLTTTDLLTCILPLYDFSTTQVQDALSLQQITDLTNWLCTPLPNTCPEVIAFIAPYRASCVIPDLDFTIGFDDDFNALTPTQLTDLETRICTPCPEPTLYSTVFDGSNEVVQYPYNAAHELERTDSFTIDVWVKISSYTLGSIVEKFDYVGVRTGWAVWLINNGQVVFELAANEGTANTVTTITVAQIPLNTWTRITIVYTGTSTAAGVTMYLNKVSTAYTVYQSPVTATTQDASNVVTIGGVAPAYFAGKIFNVMVYKNRALSGAEVAALPLYTTTPQYQADLIVWNWMGRGSLYSQVGNIRIYPDETGLTSGSQSVNMEIGDISVDIPT